MSTKLYLILSAVLITAFMAAIYIAINSTTQPVMATAQTSQTVNKVCDDSTTKITHKSNTQKKPISNQSATTRMDEDSSSNVLTILNLWYKLDNPSDTLNVRIDPRIKGAKKIGINSRILSSLSNDDRIQLPSIEDEKYLLHIKNIITKKDKAMEIYGEIDHKGAIYSSTITLTDGNLFALLTTPDGNYDIRMAENKGYIYKSGQLDDTDELDSAESITDLPGFLN